MTTVTETAKLIFEGDASKLASAANVGQSAIAAFGGAIADFDRKSKTAWDRLLDASPTLTRLQSQLRQTEAGFGNLGGAVTSALGHTRGLIAGFGDLAGLWNNAKGIIGGVVDALDSLGKKLGWVYVQTNALRRDRRGRALRVDEMELQAREMTQALGEAPPITASELLVDFARLRDSVTTTSLDVPADVQNRGAAAVDAWIRRQTGAGPDDSAYWTPRSSSTAAPREQFGLIGDVAKGLEALGDTLSVGLKNVLLRAQIALSETSAQWQEDAASGAGALIGGAVQAGASQSLERLTEVGAGPDQLAAEERMAKFAEWSSVLEDRQTLMGGAFGALTDGIGAAVSAAIDGSESIGRAFLRASANALKALAVESAVRAAFNLAMGLGAAFIDPPAAAGYFAASAQFTATALLAGAGGALLGSAVGAPSSGGGSHPAGGPSGAHYMRPTAGGGGGGDNRPIVIQIGEGFVGDERKLAAEISRALEKGERAGSISTAPRATRLKS